MSFGLGSLSILFAILGLAGIGLSFAAILAGVLFGRGLLRRWLIAVILLMGALLVMLVAGQKILECYGLGWRRWVEGLLLLAVAMLLATAILMTQRIMATQPVGRDGADQVVTLVSIVALGALLFYGGVALIFGNWTDRVTEYPEGQGQKAVAESVGIFHEKVYRYVNPFVHGELIYEWKD